MSTGLKPYPSYKDSGVEWLGRIPAHWRVKRLKYAVRSGRKGGMLIKGQMANEPADGFFPGYSASGQDVWVDEAEYHEPGIVLSAVGARCGKAFRADDDWTAIANTHVLLPNRGFDRDFLWRIFDDEKFWEKGGSAQPYVQVSDSLDRAWAFPSQVEQQSIASFLDRATAKIDALVAKKERLIESLQEKRTALISHAVTKGLDPNAPMKDSGIPWLGHIPKHWQEERFRHVTTRVDVGIAEAATHAYADEGVPILRSTNVRPNRILLDDILRIQPWFAEKNRSKYLLKDDIVTVRTGNAGVSAVIPDELHRSQCFTMLMSTLRSKQCARFYSYFLNAEAGQTVFSLEAWGTAQANISVPILREVPVVEPPFDEQQAIVEYLDRETTKLDALMAKVRTAIERLQEYRTALISAAVTGEMDVRGVV